jgi:hypothetical protein
MVSLSIEINNSTSDVNSLLDKRNIYFIKLIERLLDRQDNGKNKREKGQAMACKTLHRKLKIEQHEPQ